jgi:hypothetical protein
MADITEGNLTFNFAFDAIKFDDTDYYRNHFGKVHVRACRNKKNPCSRTILKAVPAVDILAVNTTTGYLIEVKDFTLETEEKRLDDLIEQFLGKVFLTLSAILPMKINATITDEQNFADLFSKVSQIEVILHIELPPTSSPLTLASWNRSNIQIDLKRKLKGNINPKVVSKTDLQSLPWTVT